MGAVTGMPFAKGGVVHMWGGGDLVSAAKDVGGTAVNAMRDPVGTAQTVGGMATGLANGVLGPLQQNGGLLGLPGAAPEAAKIEQGTTVGDVQGAQQGAANSLQSQQALLQALQRQGGLGMQNTAANNQLGLANQLQAANGVGAQQNAISGLQNTAGMYQNIAQGNGPNPAQAMLNQATGQNVANQAALMASQRGAGANVGLMARQAAQQGAGIQQQAAGQGATMQANQQLNALAGLTGAQQAVGGLGSGLTNQQTNANQAYANQSNQIAGQQIGATTANTQANLANQQAMQNALQGINNSNVANQGNVNNANASLSQSNSKAKQDILGGIFQGGGAAASSMGGPAAAAAARGGMVHMAGGGVPNMTPMTPPPAPNMTPMAQPTGPASSFGQYIAANPFGAEAPSENEKDSNEMLKNDQPKFGGSALEKGIASATYDAGKKAASRGGLANGGGKVAAKKESEKAVKGGNSYSNDKIPAMLSESEIVLPRSITLSKDPVNNAAKFVAQVLAKRKAKK